MERVRALHEQSMHLFGNEYKQYKCEWEIGACLISISLLLLFGRLWIAEKII